jgi:hypothetical protein
MRIHPLLCLLVFITVISGTACRSGSKISQRINALVVASEDSIKVAEEPLDTIKAYDSLQIEFGEKLSVPLDSITDLRLYSFIKSKLGIKCAGRYKKISNCESFLPSLFKEVYNLEIPATAEAQMNSKNFELFKDTSFLKQGDLLFFNHSLKEKYKISHTGFYLQNGYFLVATYSEGIIITAFSKEYWSRHFAAAARLLEKKEDKLYNL